MKKINQYKRTYHKETGALIGLMICIIVLQISLLTKTDEPTEKHPPITVHKDVIEYVVASTTPTVEDKIRQYFPRSWKTMIAISKAETHGTMSMDSKGWNCYYYQGVATTTPIRGGSMACKVKDRHLAWSVDCFLLQKNYKGQQCPKGMTLDKHLQEVADLSRVQGLSAWTSYNDGKHLKYLADSN